MTEPDEPSQPKPQPLSYETPQAHGTKNPYDIAAIGSAALFFLLGFGAAVDGSGILIFGAVCCPFAAVGLGIAARRWDRDRGIYRAVPAIWLGAGELALLLAISVILPSLGRAREPAKRVMCATNLRQIGQACALYAQANGGQYPDSFERVLITEDISAEVFCCPSADSEKAIGPTTRALLADFRKPGRCSYIYLGAGLREPIDPKAVIAYEPLADHDNDGINVLYGDGTVDFLPTDKAKALIATLPPATTALPPTTRGAGE